MRLTPGHFVRFGAIVGWYFAVGVCLSSTVAETINEEQYTAESDTGRSIALEVVVDGTPDQLFEDWATETGIARFLGSGSNVEPRIGGLYEIDFGRLPDGTVLGPRNNRILRYDSPQLLHFEWTMPSFADELNTHPLPTWVEIRFEPFGAGRDRTLVRLSHHGFGQGDLWDQCFSFFQRGWFDILFRMKIHRTYFVYSS